MPADSLMDFIDERTLVRQLAHGHRPGDSRNSRLSALDEERRPLLVNDTTEEEEPAETDNAEGEGEKVPETMMERYVAARLVVVMLTEFVGTFPASKPLRNGTRKTSPRR